VSIDLFLPELSGKPGAMRSSFAYGRFAEELGAALRDEIVIREMPLREIAPDGVSLLHAVGDLAPLAKGAAVGLLRNTIVLGVRPPDIAALLEDFAPAGLVDLPALNLWRLRRPLDAANSGVLLRADFFTADRPGTPLAGTPLASARPRGETLTEYLADYLAWLLARG
jgi:hypothetical protein